MDTEIIIRKHHLPHVFPSDVLEESARLARPVSEPDRAGRQDFRDLPIVTIDGETARDFDDAVYVERREDGGWLLQVHIADVAHYVPAGIPARPRRTPARQLRLFHRSRRAYASGSSFQRRLLPQSARRSPGYERHHEFRRAGHPLAAVMVPGVIRSSERMTYTNVNRVLTGDPEMSERYAHLHHHFRAMRGLALLLKARRDENGSIDFDLPEPIIEFDEQQNMTNIGRSERNIAHRIIEEFMLAANRAVAHYLLARGIHALHRVHENPTAARSSNLKSSPAPLAILSASKIFISAKSPCATAKFPSPAKAGRPETRGYGRERQQRVSFPARTSSSPRSTTSAWSRSSPATPRNASLSYPMLRSLKQARYSADSLGHFALGFDEYTHFTSPIRRYPDLIVHRILKWALANPEAKAPSFIKPAVGAEAALYSQKHLEEIAAETSDTERRAASAERELIAWKTAQFMEQHLGDEYDGLIISVQKYGCFVELLDIFVEGLLPIGAFEDAADARCVFRERDHAIVAVPGGDGRRGGAAANKSPRHPGNSAIASASAPSASTPCAAASNSPSSPPPLSPNPQPSSRGPPASRRRRDIFFPTPQFELNRTKLLHVRRHLSLCGFECDKTALEASWIPLRFVRLTKMPPSPTSFSEQHSASISSSTD